MVGVAMTDERMTPQEWSEAAGRYRERDAVLTAKANRALDVGDRIGAYLLFGSAFAYEEAAIDADAKAMEPDHGQ
jgi:opacity protein-like surface antigen